MGCFNLKGYLSHADITYEDKIVVMIGLCRGGNKPEIFYPCDRVVPVALPIYGTYNDYGGIENVENDDVCKYLTEHYACKEHFGNYDTIEGIINTVAHCEQFKSINDAIEKNYLNEYELEIVKKLIPSALRDCNLCLLVEHRDFFDICRVPDNREGFVYANLDEYLEASFPNTFISISECFCNGAYSILCCHPKDFLKSHKKEVRDLQRHVWWMNEHHRHFSTPMQYTQETFYDDEIAYHELCISLNKKLKENYQKRIDFEL